MVIVYNYFIYVTNLAFTLYDFDYMKACLFVSYTKKLKVAYILFCRHSLKKYIRPRLLLVLET